MLTQVRFVLNLLDPRARRKIFIFSGFRILLSGLDIIGVLLIGLLLSTLANGYSSSGDLTQNIAGIEIAILGEISVVQIAFLAAISFLAKSFLAAFFTKVMLDTLRDSETQLATEAFNRIMMNLSWSATKYSKSDIVFMLSSAISGAIEILVFTITIISESTLLLVMLISFFIIDFPTTVFVVLYFFCIIYILNNYLGKKYRESGQVGSTASIEANTVILDSINAYREIKSFKVEEYFLNSYRQPRFVSARASYQIQFLNNVPRYVVESSLIVGSFGLIYFTLKFNNVSDSVKSIGIFLTGALRMMASVLPLQGAIGNYNHQIMRAKPYFDFINSLEDQEQDKSETKPFNKDGCGSVGIILDNVSYLYPSSKDNAINRISLEIGCGEFIALIGPSGSGKSTLADLIIGITRPTSGNLKYVSKLIDDVSISDFKIGYVPQSPGIISGSIKQNIALGIEESKIDYDSLNEAIDLAQLRPLIDSLDDGFESDLGKQQDGLSGGQLQRIGLARALYVKPSLLVLDEATSALDAESEAAVTQSLNKLRGKTTIVVIAHRLSTVKNADIVHVLDQGKLVASDKFAQLAKSNNLVSRYVELSDLNAT